METQQTPAHLKVWFESSAFEQQFHTDAPLGAWMDTEGTHFALWAPTAKNVTLFLYPDGDRSAAIRSIAMLMGERGVWHYDDARRLDGVYYDYVVTADGSLGRTQDPYARACGVNGQRSMVVDLSATDPEGWDEDHAPAKQPEDVIYELHVKDFTWDEHSGVPESLRGKFKALTLSNTTLDGAGECPTCVNHVRQLGATHVQLLPVYDYGSVDEAGAPDAFNWGYDPVNYNIPEGSYATDPHHGQVRIREMKEAVMALHRSGFRVIMDVVYNHTYYLRESCLFKTVPWYYYRQHADGTASNGSGCGSEIASERSMAARYILDSVLYWAEEYHIDGFRFDLMGMLDVPLMNRVQLELDKRFGKGEKLVYGEPWAGGECHPVAGTELAHKANMKRLNGMIGAFSDNTRDAVKGSVMDEMSRGFVNGGGMPVEKLVSCVCAWAGVYGDFATPFQSITYLSAHDDWTLWDKLVCTLDEKRDFTGLTDRVIQANKLAFAILTGCQGHLFLLSGEEFGRTKRGVKNSYNAPLSVNAMDWQRCADNHQLVEYYRGLIELRKQLPGLRDKSAAAGERILDHRQFSRDCAAVLLDNDRESPWPEIILAYNAGATPVTVNLPHGQWVVLADEESSLLWQQPEKTGGIASIPANGALILGRVRA